jgi:hypothetical protein
MSMINAQMDFRKFVANEHLSANWNNISANTHAFCNDLIQIVIKYAEHASNSTEYETTGRGSEGKMSPKQEKAILAVI